MYTVWRIWAIFLILYGFVDSRFVNAQTAPFPAPIVAATAKGPNQINLTWKATTNPGYGYLVEIQSNLDSRYASWRELRPIPDAAGYRCDGTVVIRDGKCTTSDPSGTHVYNSPSNGIPYWVTESTYTDPQDDSPAQFIAWGLKTNTAYNFRVRSYAGLTNPLYGAYSTVATATTAAYPLKYVSTGGRDTNDGNGPDPAHAWRTLAHASRALDCGQELIVMGGKYANDSIAMAQTCAAGKKAVIMVNAGEEAIITSVPATYTMALQGSYLVIDGLKSSCLSPKNGEPDIVVTGSHNALLNVETQPPVVPTEKAGVEIRGGNNLLYHAYLHDAGSPDDKQNPGGNSGYVLIVQGNTASGNLIWSNHLTRGGHDVSLCVRGCTHNRWLNNVMDGGWGMGWEAIQESQHNLVEGNFIADVGQLVKFYKPSIEVSSGNNTVRRNVSVRAKTWGLEISALSGVSAGGTRVYNNVFYAPGTCYFQSHNGGVAAYDNIVYANNICYKFTGIATELYLGNKTNKIIHNNFYPTDAAGAFQPDKRIIIWNQDAVGDFQYPQVLTYADTKYAPVFSKNTSLEAAFVNEARLDFHLAPASAMIGAGATVIDPDWGSVSGKADLGAFATHLPPQPRPVAPPKPSGGPP